jgi:DNA-binding transcriptional ArsR family regulator
VDGPDYELDELLDVSSPEQHKAMGNPTRGRILGMLLDRAMTGAQLAEALGVLKGSVSFHLRVLERAGLARVVRTAKVRGVTESYWGRTARRYEMDDGTASGATTIMRSVVAELDRRGGDAEKTDTVVLTRARLDPARAADFRERLGELVEEFRTTRDDGEPVYTLAVAYFQSEPGR